MVGKETVQHLETLIVLGQPYELLLRPVPEVYAHYRPYAHFGRSADEIETGRGVVDVGEGKAREALLLRHL